MTARVAVRGLTVELSGARLIDDVSFDIAAGQIAGLVGESGSGKTTVANAILRLLPAGARVSGSVRVDDVCLSELSDAELGRHRGPTATLMLQEPLSALNPVLTIRQQLAEPLALHRGLRGRALDEACEALLDEVGLSEPRARLEAYPHQLSGGMRQRVLLATALACQPAFLIADEPTTALDASLRMVVLRLLQRLAERHRLSVLLISHDLESVREVCSAVSVLYAGRLVEQAPSRGLFEHPTHPYTRALWAARPAATPRGQPLPTISGSVPSPRDHLAGCRFHPRCPNAIERCGHEAPPLRGETHRVACLLADLPGGEA